jgi:hypothetical protein
LPNSVWVTQRSGLLPAYDEALTVALDVKPRSSTALGRSTMRLACSSGRASRSARTTPASA